MLDLGDQQQEPDEIMGMVSGSHKNEMIIFGASMSEVAMKTDHFHDTRLLFALRYICRLSRILAYAILR